MQFFNILLFIFFICLYLFKNQKPINHIITNFFFTKFLANRFNFNFQLFNKFSKQIYFSYMYLAVKNENLEFFYVHDIYFTVFAVSVFVLGITGLIISTKYNFLLFLLNLEIVFLGIGLLFVSCSIQRGYDSTGQVYAIFVIFLAAIDSVLGLSLFIANKHCGLSLEIEEFYDTW